MIIQVSAVSMLISNKDKYGLLYRVGKCCLEAIENYKSSSIEDADIYDEKVAKKLQSAFNAITKQMKKFQIKKK